MAQRRNYNQPRETAVSEIKIKINQEETVTVMKEVEIIRHTTIPTWCGGSLCAICEFDIDDANLIAFTIPYHIEYAHEACFASAIDKRRR